MPDAAGVPDGLCVDAQGSVWSAHWGMAATRYAPDGLDRRSMPVPRPGASSCRWSDLDVLYVSSAAIDMTPADFAKAPDGGGLFTLDVGVRGLPVHRFAG